MEELVIAEATKRKKTHTGNKEPKAIPKPIHDILSGSEGR
jgi:hypothetical protein